MDCRRILEVGDIHDDERDGLGGGAGGVPRLAAAARGQGPGRPAVLDALHYFSVHSITWWALPERFGKWNSEWKRFERLSKADAFEAFFDHLA